LKNAEDLKDEIEGRLQAEIESLTNQLTQERETLTAHFTQQINNLKDDVDERTSELSEQNQVIAALRQTVHSQKEEIVERSAEMEKHAQLHKDELEKITSQNAAEKAALVDSHQQAIATLTEQCRAHREDIQQVTARLAVESRKGKAVRKELFEAKVAVGKFAAEVIGLTEQAEREKRLHEAALRAASLNLEAGFEQRSLEAKSRSEGEKRSLFAFVAEQFRQFCDVSQNLNEGNFRDLVIRVKQEFASLLEMEVALRRLTNTTQNQSVQEAVEQIVIERRS
jgi:chromosome segregation ATPase